MTYTINVSYSICALILLLYMTMFMLQRKKVNILQNRIYLILLGLGMLSSICNIWNANLVNAGSVDLVQLNLSKMMVFVFQICAISGFASYVKSLVELTFRNLKTKVLLAYHGPATLVMILSFVTPWTGWMFNYAADGTYTRGPLFPVALLVGGYYIFLAANQLSFYRDGKGKEHSLIPVIMVSILLIAFTAQCIMPRYVMGDFGIALCILQFLMLVQRPEEAEDPSTGAFNKFTFEKVYDIRQRKEHKYYGVLVFVEDTRTLNQIYGVVDVNHLLADISKYLETHVGRSVFYLGSNTFFMMIDTKKYSQVTEMLWEIDKRFEQPWKIGQNSAYVTVRMMKLRVPEDVNELQGIYAYADYLRELDNSQKWILSATETNIKTTNRRLLVEDALKKAIRKDLFEVHYQPIYSVADRKICSAEALVRYTDDELGPIAPAEFIPIAEQNGMVLKIGSMVFEKVCKFTRDHMMRQKGVSYIEINLSIVQCMQETLAEELMEIMRTYGVDSSRVNLEITETAAVSSPRMLVKNMKRLFDHGVSFSLDDFGTGYSNINSLIELPLDMIKFDKTMIDSVCRDDRGKILLISSIAMVKRMGMSIVAEGVETKAQAEMLAELGVDYLQGYYFSRPLPEEKFVEFVENFNADELMK